MTFPGRLAVVLALTARCAAAADFANVADPFATAVLTPPRPSLAAGGAAATSPCAPRPDGVPLNLADIVDLALCNNPRTREAWANARAAAAQVGVAEAAFLPELDASVGLRRDRRDGDAANTSSAGLTLSYLLYDFGGRDAGRESARQLLAAAAASQDDAVQSVFLAAIEAYYQTQATRAAVVAAGQAERSSRTSFDAAAARHAAGSATLADRLQAQTALSQAVLDRIRAEGDMRNAQGALANVVGRDAHRPLAVVELPPPATPTADFERDVAALVESARQRRPDLRAATAQLRAAEAGVEAARAAGRPTINLTASASHQDVGGLSSQSGSLGVSLSLPLFGGFAPTYRIRAAEAQAEARAVQLERVRLQVALDVWNGVQNLTTATQSLRSSADLLASAEQSERVALGRYQAGVGTLVDALNAQSALASARRQAIQAGYSWNLARATLAQAIGSLDLGLLDELAAAGVNPASIPSAPANSRP